MSVDATPRDFSDFALPAPLLRALQDVGYESPSPIQAATIPPLLQGRDVLGQAQTGTGKTAAFALPALARLDPGVKRLINPHIYHVSLSDALWRVKQDLIRNFQGAK
mgnify:CR=1 FL=1